MNFILSFLRKKTSNYILIICLTISHFMQGQAILFGLTNKGGDNAGTLFSTDRTGRNEALKYKFIQRNEGGIHPQGGLVVGSNGKLYGTTYEGGSRGFGTLFEYNIQDSLFLKKHDFSESMFEIDGGNPNSRPIKGFNGKLYGTTTWAGKFGAGTIYEYNTDSSTYKNIWDFNDDDLIRGFPMGSLLQAPNGMFYGTTPYGGCLPGPCSLAGSFFEFNPINHTIRVIKNFESPPVSVGAYDGSYDLAMTNGGKIYGESIILGIIFEYDPATDVFLTVSGLQNINQSFTTGANGKLYTYSNFPEGIIEFDPVTNVAVTKYLFTGTDGFGGFGQMTLGANGKLYGNTYFGGANNKGTLFEYDPATNIFIKKYDFENSPYLTIPIQHPNGKLYGTTWDGGVDDIGTLYEFDLINNKYKKLHDFLLETANDSPQSSVVYATDSIFYGLTYGGGSDNNGSLFSFNPRTNVYSKKMDFDNTLTGANPYGSLIQATDGKFYAMTSSGGSNNKGTLFSYDAMTNIFTKKYDFITSSGFNPYGSLLQAPDGLMYGMTTQGGSSNYGVLFSYNSTTTSYIKKIDLDSITQGGHPTGNLILDPITGKLYGLTSSGGSSGKGTIFSYDYAGNTFTNVFNLNILSGANPTGSLVLANNNLLYGLTSAGGANNLGTLFSFNPAGNIFTKIIDFTSITGSNSMGSLRLVSNGKLYGMTHKGGANDLGTVFEFDPVTNAFTKTVDFDGISGANPTYGNLVEICLIPRIILQPQNATTCTGSAFQLNITATGGPSYQWYANNQSITGATNSILAITNALIGNQIYYCKVMNECGTITSLIVTVTGNPLPTITGSVLPNKICVGNSVTISATGASLLSITGGIILDNSFIPTVTGITAYTITGRDANGCVDKEMVNVTVNGLSILSISGITSICPGISATLTVSGANTYSWSNGLTTSGISVSPLTSTTYSVTGIDMNGCQSSAIPVVSVSSIVNIPITGDISICKGDSTTFLAENISSVTWFNNLTTSSIVLYPLDDNTPVSLTGITTQGCIGQGFATIRLHELPVISVSGQTDLCIGETATLSVSGAKYYTWNNQSTDTKIDVSPNEAETFTATGIDANGCEASATHTIIVNNVPAVSLNLSTINNQCDTLSPIPLTGGLPESGTYWYNSRSIINLNTSLAGEYLILYKYTDQNGCINTATGVLTSIHCTVPGICERPNPPCHCTNTCPPRFKVYTGITPNNDGKNDTWLIDSLSVENTVAVVDKWGNEVYRQDHYNNDWDGRQNGKELPAGVYYYMVENDRKRFSGTLSIIR